MQYIFLRKKLSNTLKKTCFKLVLYLEKNKIKLFEDDDKNMTVVKCELSFLAPKEES